MRSGVLTLILNTLILTAQTHKTEALEQAQAGLALAQKANYKAAIDAYRQAISIEPNVPGIYLNLGLAYFKLGDFAHAAPAFEKEIAQHPNDQASTLLAMCYFGAGKYREASERLKPLAAAQPENTELSYLLAKCYLWSDQYKEALEVFERLRIRDPNSVAVHMLLGEAMDAYSRTEQAAAEFEAAAKMAPEQPEVHFGLGYLYWKLKRYDDAAREFRLELKNNPKHARAMAYLGDTGIRSGGRPEAVDLLEAAVKIENNLEIAHLDLGLIFADRKTPDRAIAELKQATRINPSGFAAHYRLARLYRETGNESEARREFAIVQKLHREKDEKPLVTVSGAEKK